MDLNMMHMMNTAAEHTHTHTSLQHKALDKVRSQLQVMGYKNVPDELLLDFIRQASKETSLGKCLDTPSSSSGAGRPLVPDENNANALNTIMAVHAPLKPAPFVPTTTTAATMSTITTATARTSPEKKFADYRPGARLVEDTDPEMWLEGENDRLPLPHRRSVMPPSLPHDKPTRPVHIPMAVLPTDVTTTTTTIKPQRPLSSGYDTSRIANATAVIRRLARTNPNPSDSDEEHDAPTQRDASPKFRPTSAPTGRPRVMAFQAAANRLECEYRRSLLPQAPKPSRPSTASSRVPSVAPLRRLQSPSLVRRGGGTAALGKKSDRVNNYQWYAAQWAQQGSRRPASARPHATLARQPSANYHDKDMAFVESLARF
eukprot:gnl/Spiro4/22670_TR11183_c0_g1_i1.p1 gnl/Spiro4/22670_TR11183_c0_g1~~gnl/Spiro4/22670_TR11183_c0_g1_i1.p1  ORF type:complete len:390 (-),score=100.77 gnl/Spiro4/22670_TR11183_c0_g1_i1:59-1177(-)